MTFILIIIILIWVFKETEVTSKTDNELALEAATLIAQGKVIANGSPGLTMPAADRLAMADALTRLANHGGRTSPELAALGSLAMNHPENLSLDQIKSLGGCVVGQAPDHG